MEAKRTPLLETLVQNVARLCAQLVAAGPPAVLTTYPTSHPVDAMQDEGLTLKTGFPQLRPATAVENP